MARPSLTESLLASQNGWTNLTSNQQRFQIHNESNFNDAIFGEEFSQTLIDLAEGMEQFLSSRRRQVCDVNIFIALVQPAILHLVDCTQQQLVKAREHTVTEKEMWQFVATMIFRQSFNMPKEMAFDAMAALLPDIDLLTPKHYSTLMSSLRGYDVVGRTADEGTRIWFKQSNLLRKMEDIEKLLFSQSNKILLSRRMSGVVFVLDDELVASRANDVELKTLSNRKSGKEGPVADCLSCSLTNVMFGMRLRVKGEAQQTNITKLLQSTSARKGARLTFDRGYGKFPFVSKMAEEPYNVSTVAAPLGSRHPFIPQEEVESMVRRQQSNNVPQDRIRDMLEPVIPWILTVADKGAEYFYAVKTLDGGKQVYAFAINEVFDKKCESKLLRFFVSGLAEQYFSSWIAIEKTVGIPEKTLFVTNKTKSAELTAVESVLANTCQALTVGQCCADWFQMRCYRITGTMASKIKQLPDVGEPSVEVLQLLMNQCIQSWFNRARSTAQMAEGTANEKATTDALVEEPFVLALFEVGLLQMVEYPYLGVSPDGIILLQRGNARVYATVEIKTRVGEKSKCTAMEALNEHGRVIFCAYDDETFKSCVPSEHRDQLLHQAAVTGLDHAVYVVSVVDDEEGRVLQIVIANVFEHQRQEHINRLLTYTKPLLAWLHSDIPMERGYLIEDDFPPWVLPQQASILASRVKMWYAFMAYIRTDDGKYVPTRPLNLFKHAVQFLYNKGKGGLDKATELEERIRGGSKSSFETKYIRRMINAVVINAWRVGQANKLKPQLMMHDYTSLAKIRRQLWDEGIQGFKTELAKNRLKALYHDTAFGPGPIDTTCIQIQNNAREICTTLQNMKRRNTFPVRRSRVEAFSAGFLKQMRLHQSQYFCHSVVSWSASKQKRKPCTLCSIGTKKRDSSYHCKICMVSLCITPLNLTSKYSCFDVWHSCADLLRENKRRNRVLLESRNKRREAAYFNSVNANVIGNIGGGPETYEAGQFAPSLERLRDKSSEQATRPFRSPLTRATFMEESHVLVVERARNGPVTRLRSARGGPTTRRSYGK